MGRHTSRKNREKEWRTTVQENALFINGRLQQVDLDSTTSEYAPISRVIDPPCRDPRSPGKCRFASTICIISRWEETPTTHLTQTIQQPIPLAIQSTPKVSQPPSSDYTRTAHLFFCSMISCNALFFSSNDACADSICAVCSCSVNACFLDTAHHTCIYPTEPREMDDALELRRLGQLHQILRPIPSSNQRSSSRTPRDRGRTHRSGAHSASAPGPGPGASTTAQQQQQRRAAAGNVEVNCACGDGCAPIE